MADYSGFSQGDILVEINNKILTATLNRPERLNAMSPSMIDGWRQIMRMAIIITGAGRGFCSGADQGDMSQQGSDENPPDLPTVKGQLQKSPKYLVQDYLNCEVPLIAAINGPAAGLGATVALMCDVTFMADTARIGDTHVRAGLVARDGGALIWPHLVGMNRAKNSS